ncbi:MAG TPA: CaiB/BaiF CoA-transferase family protein [Solirubrobacterales bacterium]|nr:CaiB/BaiF CoA-transferase family protein [Solirubrobacterales bacterium]
MRDSGPPVPPAATGGPLAGLRVLEIGSIGPGPFAAMVLADMGADVLRVERPGTDHLLPPHHDVTLRGRPAIEIDLRDPHGRERALSLVDRADVLLEGFRPSVMERLGLGPAEAHARNAKLVYGRMTGYGQDGPMAGVAGHDINYLAVSGVLGGIRREGERPLPPLNLVGDYGGGGMLLAFGVLCAVFEATRSGRGQVVDAAMVDGAALLSSLIHGMRSAGQWSGPPGTNMLDTGAPFYEVYETGDGGHVAVGAIEPQFYARLLKLLTIDAADAPQWERERWPQVKDRFAAVFRARSTSDWEVLLEHEEACATIVRGFGDAPSHPHLRARGTFVDIAGVVQPQAAPRFDRTPGAARPRPVDARQALERWGVLGLG